MEKQTFSLAAMALDFCPPQNASRMPLILTATERSDAKNFSERTSPKEFCVYTFGKERQPSSLEQSVYSALLDACCDPESIDITPCPNSHRFPRRLWHRIKWLRNLYRTFGEIDNQLNALKNYQPQNAVQLKNLLQSYYNLSKTQLHNLNALYQEDINIFWRITLFFIDKTRSGFSSNSIPKFLRLNSIPKVNSDWAFKDFFRSTYAVVGSFTLNEKRYEVRAQAILNHGITTYFGIFEENTQKIEFTRHHFLVRMERYPVIENRSTHTEQQMDSETSWPRQEVRDDQRMLIIKAECRDRDQEKRPLDEKLIQIMVEVMLRNEGIKKILISQPSKDDDFILTAGGFAGENPPPHRANLKQIHLNAIAAIRAKRNDPRIYPPQGYEIGMEGYMDLALRNSELNQPNVHFNGNKAQSWKEIITESPILHSTGGFVPELWAIPLSL